MSEVQDPLVLIDADHLIVDANGPFMRMFQLSKDDLASTSIHTLVPEALRDGHVANVESMFRTPVVRSMADPRSRVRGVRADGQTFPLNVTFFPVRSDPASRECTHFAAIVVERTQASTPVWRQPENWIPVITSAAAVVGWLLGIEGAKEILISVVGVRTVLGSIRTATKNP